MYSASAQLYDQIYLNFKNYEEEAEKIDALIKKVHPAAKTILDVACGSGEHARYLTEHYGYAVDGLDLEPEFVSIAQHKNQRGRFYHANMIDFQIEKTYDVVLCLFSSIGYVRTSENVVQTLRTFKKHTTTAGLIIVEPWLKPEQWTPGKLFLNTVEDDKLKICRMSYSERTGNISRINFEYLVGRENGITHLTEVHELGLFTEAEMKACFHTAGLTYDYDPQGLTGRGLYVAK